MSTTNPVHESEAAASSGPSLDDLKRTFFAPEDAERAAEAIEQARQVCHSHGIPVAFNWPAEKGEPLPEGYGVAVLPITRRASAGQGNQVIGCYIAGIPTLEAIAAHPKGDQFVRDQVASTLMNKLANAARPRGDDTAVGQSVPFSVADFIERADRDQGLTFFREHAGSYVKALNKLFKRKVMNATLLRQVLASRAFAEQQFPKVQQSQWEGLLRKMIQQAEQAGEDPGIVRVWLETRDETQIDIESDWDMDDFESMLSAEA